MEAAWWYWMSLVNALRMLRRTGWNQDQNGHFRRVPYPESVAAHSYAVAMAVLFHRGELEADGYDVIKLYELALIHDIVEALVGDACLYVMPEDQRPVAQRQKDARERKAAQTIRDKLGGILGTRLHDLWQEYQDRSSREAELICDFDKADFPRLVFDYAACDDCDVNPTRTVGGLVQNMTHEITRRIKQGLLDRVERFKRRTT